MTRWVLVVPLHDSSQLNAHNTTKMAEIKALGLPYVAPNFEVMIQDLESFDTTSRAVRALMRQAWAIPVLPASDEQVEQWSEASENLVATLRRKLRKRLGTGEDQLNQSVGELIRWFLERENALELLRATFPELHEALAGVISRQSQRLSLSGPPADGSTHQILRSELDSLDQRLKGNTQHQRCERAPACHRHSCRVANALPS